jgi:hypothetical protein
MKINKLKNKILNNEDLIFILCLLILLMFIFKTLNIFIFTSRDSPFNYFPLNNYTGFDQFHRFTDWLIFTKISINEKMWGKDTEIAHGIPYGYIQVFINKTLFYLVNIFKPASIYENGLFLINALFIFLNLNIIFFYFTLKVFIKLFGTNRITYLYFLIFLLCNYPIWMLFDRGNADIYTLLLLGFLLHLNFKKIFKYDWLIIVLIASLKPSNALLLAPIIFFNFRIMIISGLILLINYFLPVLIYPNTDFNYMIDLIINTSKLLLNQTFYCNNLACGLRSIGIPVGNYKVLGIGLIYLNIFIVFLLTYFLKPKNNSKLFLIIVLINLLISISIKFYHLNSFILGISYNFLIVLLIIYLRFFRTKINNKISNTWQVLSASIIVTLLMNDPSPDYRLTFLIPVFLFWIYNFSNYKSNTYSKLYDIVLFSIIFGFNSLFFLQKITILKIICLNLLLLRLFNKRFEFSYLKNFKTFAKFSYRLYNIKT